MKRLIALWFAGLMLSAHPALAVVMVGFGASSGSSISCTGSNTFIRGANDSGDTEDFEYGSNDFCASDWYASGTTGINTYSTAQYKFGSHSLAITDDTSTTPSYIRAEHGSAQTSKYYR